MSAISCAAEMIPASRGCCSSMNGWKALITQPRRSDLAAVLSLSQTTNVSINVSIIPPIGSQPLSRLDAVAVVAAASASSSCSSGGTSESGSGRRGLVLRLGTSGTRSKWSCLSSTSSSSSLVGLSSSSSSLVGLSSSSSSLSSRELGSYYKTCVDQGRRCFRKLPVRGAAGSPRSDMATATADADTLDVAIKAATGRPDLVGDCPFSQRVTMTLEEKGIKYNPILIDVSNKPEWFLEANPLGKVPVMKYQDKWIDDSDVIVGILEKDFPKPSLAVPDDKAIVGSKIFSAFVKFLKSKEPDDGSEDALLKELNKFDAHIAKEGPFINGDQISAADMSLVPKLYHLRVALKHYRGWTIPEDLKHLHAYIKATESRDSFKKTAAPEEYVIKGWEKHFIG